MKNKMTASEWLDTAVSGIQFIDDQASVREELTAHIEDKAADLQRIFPDISPEEAQERALAGMGDPEEIKKELAKVHKSWLGYIWALSELLLVLTILSGMFLGMFSGVVLLTCLPDWEAREVIFGKRETAWSKEAASRSVVMERDPELIRVDDCLLTMKRAWLLEEDEGYILQVDVRLLSPLIWVESHSFCNRISAVDSDGNTYPATTDWIWSDRPERRVNWGASSRWLPILPQLFEERYILYVNGVNPDVEWVRLEYDWMGRSFSMTVRQEEA